MKIKTCRQYKLVNELLERSAGKVARSVLRGGRQSDLPSLPDFNEATKVEKVETVPEIG
jgi:hypothetical protein